MEVYKIKNLTFKYPSSETEALNNISLTLHSGEFVTICGKSGCGKSTLLRHLKPTLTPYGEKQGEIFFEEQNIYVTDFRDQSEKIGFVFQNPDNQIVTDKVWHELAFGLESLGVPTSEIRARVAEVASFFGMQAWFYKDVIELSGGQKQLLNLASVMVMQPSVLILDEPASQLDPIATQEFFDALRKINQELGTTVILTEHRLEEAFALSDRIIVMDEGRIIADDVPKKIGEIIKNHDMFMALPVSIRVFSSVNSDSDGECPVTVREGREWLKSLAERKEINSVCLKRKMNSIGYTEKIISVRDIWFRYEKNLPDIVKGVSADIYKGELYAITGGNGTGKSTALSLISGLNTPQRGSVFINGENINGISNLYDGLIGVLPQNPQSLFLKKSLRLDLYEILLDKKMSGKEKENAVNEVSVICELNGLLDKHPYDLSGGEQQRAALAKILLFKPRILLLDEPTKGLDSHFKKKFASILYKLKESGVTIIMVSHDIEFCAEYADRCAMFFDGNIVSENEPRGFFSDKSFYTTAANRMSRNIVTDAVLAEDIITACGGTVARQDITSTKTNIYQDSTENRHDEKNKSITKPKLFAGILLAVLFVMSILSSRRFEGTLNNINQLLSIVFAAISLSCLLPQKILGVQSSALRLSENRRQLTKKAIVSTVIILIIIPLTIYTGIYFLGDRKYYFISLLIIIEIMLPFVFIFENRKLHARELVIISVLCAVGVAGRTVFFMLPQFKPLIALVIIAGVCFGGETGFLIGAMTGFVSNFFFGQGPWTPWQMFAIGVIGYLAGVLFKKGFLSTTRGSLCVFGGLGTIVIYGGIMNPASVIMWQAKPTAEMLISSYAMGLPFDIIHAAATVFFLWFAAGPMIEKLERIKVKYGIIE